MNAQTIVWAYQPLDELGGRVEFVECDEALARLLIDADLVDDPRIGDRYLRAVQADGRRRAKPVEPTEPTRPDVSHETGQTYDTRVMEPRQLDRRFEPPPAKRGPGRPRKVR
jgi:hypothetical protein